MRLKSKCINSGQLFLISFFNVNAPIQILHNGMAQVSTEIKIDISASLDLIVYDDIQLLKSSGLKCKPANENQALN